MTALDQRQFTNAVRSLFNIDGYLLPELTSEQQGQFLRDPVRYFIGTDKAQQDAIFREVVKRQLPPVAALTMAAPALEKMRDELHHYLVNKITLHEPKGYGHTKTSGWPGAIVPEWQLRRWESVSLQPVHSAPFSSYPEDRAKLLNLARKCEVPDDADDADVAELADLVRAILEDEAVQA